MVQTAFKPSAPAIITTHRAALVARLRDALADQGRETSDFELNPSLRPKAAQLRDAGVLIAITPAEEVILTKRSSHLKHHPGQIALPGGKMDPTDAGPIAAALREAEEEVALPRSSAEVLGTMPIHATVTNFAITPVVALVAEFTPVAEAGEVAEVFRVPLAHLTDPDKYSVQSRISQGQIRSYYAVPYGPYYIWGATARILRALAARLA